MTCGRASRPDSETETGLFSGPAALPASPVNRRDANSWPQLPFKTLQIVIWATAFSSFLKLIMLYICIVRQWNVTIQTETAWTVWGFVSVWPVDKHKSYNIQFIKQLTSTKIWSYCIGSYKISNPVYIRGVTIRFNDMMHVTIHVGEMLQEQYGLI